MQNGLLVINRLVGIPIVATRASTTKKMQMQHFLSSVVKPSFLFITNRHKWSLAKLILVVLEFVIIVGLIVLIMRK
jgi:hypothetical protein